MNSASPTSATVLAIDDSPDELSLLTGLLRAARLRLIVAFEGQKGCQAVAQALLQQDPAHSPSLHSLARQVGTIEKRQTELFRPATGLPVFAWLRKERLPLARPPVAESDLDSQPIADQVGYRIPGNFTTKSRKRRSVTPRDNRQVRRESSGRDS